AGRAPRRPGRGASQHPRQPAAGRRSERRIRHCIAATADAARRMTPPRDVVILGGGLAGLTLALQLRQRDPGIDVLVLERNAHPVREAAFKVGESTVEVGAHYFAEVLGLREHLEREQLVKFGLRYFFNDRST